MVIFMCIGFIQMYSTLFDACFSFPWKMISFSKIFERVIGFSSIAKWSDYLPYYGFLIVYYIAISVIILIIIDIFFVSYSFTKKRFL